MRTAVLIHGFHLDSGLTIEGKNRTWRDLVIGELRPHDATGRATYGLLVALREEAELVVFSTGASRKDGLCEAEYTYRALLEHIDEAAEAFGVYLPGELARWLKSRVHLDTRSQTTAEELTLNLALCEERGMRRVILVTSRFHAPRALANANDVKRRLGFEKLTIFATAPEDVSPAPLIFEPPTRPDRPSVAWNETLRGVFGIPAERQREAADEIAAVIARHSAK